MKKWNGYLRELPSSIKWFIGLFLILLSFGYSSGIKFVDYTTHITPQGIEENYLGNEDDEEAATMKYKKTQREMLTMLHTHITSLSLIFFTVGILVFATSLPLGWKKFLALEPLFSILFTFGGIYLTWVGLIWMKYIVLLSGILMTLCFTAGVIFILLELLKKPRAN